jgi:hypothetical protein
VLLGNEINPEVIRKENSSRTIAICSQAKDRGYVSPPHRRIDLVTYHNAAEPIFIHLAGETLLSHKNRFCGIVRRLMDNFTGRPSLLRGTWLFSYFFIKTAQDCPRHNMPTSCLALITCGGIVAGIEKDLAHAVI